MKTTLFPVIEEPLRPSTSSKATIYDAQRFAFHRQQKYLATGIMVPDDEENVTHCVRKQVEFQVTRSVPSIPAWMQTMEDRVLDF